MENRPRGTKEAEIGDMVYPLDLADNNEFKKVFFNGKEFEFLADYGKRVFRVSCFRLAESRR